MPLIFDGVTIPENVANALSFNGTNITQVIANGTTVWTQSLFSGIWSGSSMVGAEGISTSGSSHRAAYLSLFGGWIVSSPTDLGSGTTEVVSLSTYKIVTTSSTIRLELSTNIGANASFNKASGFSGSSTAANYSFITSGGSIKFDNNGVSGAWITLT